MIKQQWHNHIPDEFFKQRAPSSRNNLVFGVGINDSDYATRYGERVYKSDGTAERVELWRREKYRLAKQLADQEDNKMVAEALIERYKLD